MMEGRREMLRRLTAAMLVLALGPWGAAADVFVLRGGGRIEGELLDDESPRKQYHVRLATGGDVVLDAMQVQEHQPVSADEALYQQIRPSFADSAEGQWALAEWCRERGLFDRRDEHLERTIEIDTNHAAARRALGYNNYNGQWARQDDVMEARGMVRYKGRYRTPQEVELMEARAKQDIAEKEWMQKIGRWRSWLTTDKAQVARENLRTVEEPAAIKAFIQGLRDDQRPEIRALFAELLARFTTPEAIKALAVSALEDRNEEVRLTCLDHLERRPNPDAVAYFCSQLKSKDNMIVNRAGAALGTMRDPTSIAPLIEALVTEHKYKITEGSGGGGGSGGTPYSVGFGSGGGGGFNFGSKTKIVTQKKANQTVLDALVAITRQNYSFNEAEWRKWFAMQRQRETIDARRD